MGLPTAPPALPPKQIRSPPLPPALAAAAAGPAAVGGLGVDAGDRRLDLQGRRWALRSRSGQGGVGAEMGASISQVEVRIGGA